MLAIPESISNGGRIVLVPVELSHAREVYEAAVESKDEIIPWMQWFHPEYSIEDAERWATNCRKAWEADAEYSFVVREAKTSQVLGTCSIRQADRPHRVGDLGYWIRTSRTNHGFASEATSVLAQFGFSHLGLIRIQIIVAAGNGASLRVAEKAGAYKEGLLRNRLLLGGRPTDAYIFSLIPR